MTEKQMLHAAMQNSYNLITGSATLEEIVNSGLTIFVHNPEEPIDSANLLLMIMYYEKLEHYEKCAACKKILDTLFKEEFIVDTYECSCELPKISEYKEPMCCKKCGKLLIY